jgi:hypothetical protein
LRLTKAAAVSSQTVLTLGRAISTAKVSFYGKVPSDVQVASDLSNHELVVFCHLRTSARVLAGKVKALVDFPFITHGNLDLAKFSDNYHL